LLVFIEEKLKSNNKKSIHASESEEYKQHCMLTLEKVPRYVIPLASPMVPLSVASMLLTASGSESNHKFQIKMTLLLLAL